MLHSRDIDLSIDAIAALNQILGIMTDHVLSGENNRWNVERLIELEVRLGAHARTDETVRVTLGIDDAALLLDGMAYTEVASADFSWFEMVRWTSDFVTAELRAHWSEAEWQSHLADGG